ncbi:hypothetical protein E2562_021055 [Oryza meyeriana var. granulata]|uniref:Uncharacterized protein n=1 Tax=Oryza meyeriana var. granulata TaxID=110450 RepID=A0A6G1FAL3_9ORYZ|nr:hypothetical protein E2562_021055 [Oryza meyeriana var. granulata]
MRLAPPPPQVQPKAAPNPSTTTIASLSDDIFLEVLLRLPRFAVLKPLIWDVDLLPLLPGDIELEGQGASAFTGFHLLYSDEDRCSFSVICVCREDLRFRAAAFSSETRDWIIHPWVEFAGDGNMRPMSNIGVLVDTGLTMAKEAYDAEHCDHGILQCGITMESMTQGCSFMAGETKDGGLCIVYAIDFLILVWIPRVDRNGIERWVPQKILFDTISQLDH